MNTSFNTHTHRTNSPLAVPIHLDLHSLTQLRAYGPGLHANHLQLYKQFTLTTNSGFHPYPLTRQPIHSGLVNARVKSQCLTCRFGLITVCIPYRCLKSIIITRSILRMTGGYQSETKKMVEESSKNHKTFQYASCLKIEANHDYLSVETSIHICIYIYIDGDCMRIQRLVVSLAVSFKQT